MKNILVLGASGMLGSMVVDVLSREPDVTVTAAQRSGVPRATQSHPNVRWLEQPFDAVKLAENSALLVDQSWIINCIGITKPLIHDDNPEEVANAIAVNALLPHNLGRLATKNGSKVLQIATDCVYSGAKGRYVEEDSHDALDVYGKSKSLGEACFSSMFHLRCSIIGPEPKSPKFLIEWFRRQPVNAQVNGFTNHQWNGVTTLHFARICLGIIRHDLPLSHLAHVVPSAEITKARLLAVFRSAYRRNDIQIRDVEAGSVVNRTLATSNPALNESLWKAAGYERPPDMERMIAELAEYDYRPGEAPGK